METSFLWLKALHGKDFGYLSTSIFSNPLFCSQDKGLRVCDSKIRVSLLYPRFRIIAQSDDVGIFWLSQLRWGFVGVIVLTHPQSIGHVSLRSPDPNDTPMIQMNYLQSQSDVQKLVEGIQLIRKLFQTSAFDEFRGREVAPGADVMHPPL